MNRDRNHSLHIVITNSLSELDKKSESKIDDVFDDLFNSSYKLVSRTQESAIVELIYEVQTPIFNDEVIAKDFYEDLRILLEVLQDYNPHFTQFRRVVAQ